VLNNIRAEQAVADVSAVAAAVEAGGGGASCCRTCLLTSASSRADIMSLPCWAGEWGSASSSSPSSTWSNWRAAPFAGTATSDRAET